ncbi:bifunctional helix-turn-helix transcriptional regulator/GNAT family N-acetyltransferase [uncultured Chitinophaga sp.]|jgi:Transcriptional regulators|uniref:bifunctional helix-turn-helix transcriptional regulator/GNAT family N-acetyltransferase n=1 Tax=uncultured Chitinophaga sp. TaxID=339340 RepID=UPI002621F2EC|nr:bifunctional helix-turn-helix transcriptional regulator/GNAT family N-acetyltransferase [uncultured Chitinophaga sp.]
MSTTAATISAMRKFNRFYTGVIGLLDQHILDSDFSLSEVRVLYEIWHTEQCTAGKLAERLQLDGGYLSRMLKTFEQQHIVNRKQSAADGRTWFLQLTAKGKRLMNTLDQRSNEQIRQVLDPLPAHQQQEVTRSMETIEHLLSANRKISLEDLSFRNELLPGDAGYLIYLHGDIYARETGYNLEFEAYVCKTFYDFLQQYDPAKDRVFIASWQQRIVGAVAILGHSSELAQLRWLLVHPDMRGIGLGKKLVADALAFCREKQYKQVYLLTTHQQTTAADIYIKAGFKKTGTEPQQMWGHQLREERYDLLIDN